MGLIIGIDLGTTNSAAAFMSRRRPKLLKDPRTNTDTMPSVVLVEQGEYWVGQDAKDRSPGSRNRIYSIKRFMGVDYESDHVQSALQHVSFATRKSESGETEVVVNDEIFTPQQISSMILSQIKRNVELVLGDVVTHAVITVPAYFSQRQKQATREAGRMADLHVARILNEPTAAALAFGTDRTSDTAEQVLVYDFGGGTFDVSILMIAGGSYDVFNYDGDNFLGGDTIDDRIVDRLFQSLEEQHGVDLRGDLYVRNRLKHLAEQAKIRLSLQDEVHITEEQIALQDAVPTNVDFVLTRAEFDALIEDIVQRTIEITRRCLAGAHLESDAIDRVLLVGGSTRIPLVREHLRTLFGDRIEFDVDPMQCVALGAAVMASSLAADDYDADESEESTEEQEKPEIIDITSKHLGVEVEDEGEAKRLAIVIEKQTAFPTNEPRRYVFYTSYSNQQRYRLPVYEVEAVDVHEAEAQPKEKWEHVGVVENNRLPPGLPVNTPVSVEMSIDQDGLLTVSSYLKNDRERTFVEHSFRFIGSLAQTETENAETDELETQKEQLQFHVQMFQAIATESALNAYLHEDQLSELTDFAESAASALEDGTAAAVLPSLAMAQRLRTELPVPTEDVFWAHVFLRSPETLSLLEQREIQQALQGLRRSMSADDLDAADESLAQLRHIIQSVLAKEPEEGHLLRRSRL